MPQERIQPAILNLIQNSEFWRTVRGLISNAGILSVSGEAILPQERIQPAILNLIQNSEFWRPVRGVISKVRRIIQIFVEMHKLNRDNAQIPSLNIINPCKTHLKHGIMISYRRTCPLPGAAAKLFRRTQENVQDSYQENPQPHSYSYGS